MRVSVKLLQYGDMLRRSYAPECVLNRLHSTLLADSLCTWYSYREKACKEIHNLVFMIWEIFNVYGLIETSGPEPNNIYFMRISMKRVFSLSQRPS